MLAASKNQETRILLIEDDTVFSRVFERLGKQNGTEVRTCRTLEEVPHVLASFSPDVAVVDFFMGQETGLEALSHLKTKTPVLITSAVDKVFEDGEAPWLGRPACFLSKSYGAEALFEQAQKMARSIESPFAALCGLFKP